MAVPHIKNVPCAYLIRKPIWLVFWPSFPTLVFPFGERHFGRYISISSCVTCRISRPSYSVVSPYRQGFGTYLLIWIHCCFRDFPSLTPSSFQIWPVASSIHVGIPVFVVCLPQFGHSCALSWAPSLSASSFPGGRSS